MINHPAVACRSEIQVTFFDYSEQVERTINHPIPQSTTPSLDILVLIESDPNLTQRQLAKKVGISLGSVNFVLKGLIEKGFVKAGNFSASSNKAGYLYLLTPEGIYEKSRLTEAFVRRKLEEYERLTAEINRLRALGLLPAESGPQVLAGNVTLGE